MNEFPKISVLIPVYNEEKYISETIGFIKNQDYPHDKLEIIVADGGSSDKTAEIIRSIAKNDPRIKLIDNPGRLSSSGRNCGIENSSGDIVTFIDGHTYIDNDQLLKNTALLMQEKNVSVLSRPQFLSTPNNSFIQKAIALARKSLIGHGLDSTIYTDKDLYVDPTSSGASYKKEIFNDIGLYDERFDACEDVELNYRTAQKDYESFTSLKLAVYYYPRTTICGLFNQMKRYGMGRVRLACKHKSSLSLGTIIPLLMTIGIPLALLLSILIPEITLPIGLYLLILLGWSAKIAFQEGLALFPVLPFIYLAIHFGLGWGSLIEAIKTLLGRGYSFGDE